MKRLLALVGRHRRHAAAGAILLLLQAVAPAATALGVALSVRDLSAQMGGSSGSLVALGALIVADSLVTIVRTRITRGIALAVSADLRLELVSASLRAGGGFGPLGKRINRLLADADDVAVAVSGLTTLLRNPVALLLLLGSASALSVGWTWLFVTVAPLVLLAAILASRRIRVAADRAAVVRADLAAEFADVLAAAPMLAAFGMTEAESVRLARAVKSDAAARLSVDLARLGPATAGRFVAVGALLAAGLYGASRGNPIDMGALAGVVTAGALALRPLSALGEGWGMMQRGLAALRRIDEAIAELPPQTTGMAQLPPGPLGVSVERAIVNLGSALILDSVTVEARPGARVAVVGRVGAGKSTLLGLLAGEITAASGQVRIAGIPLGDFAGRSAAVAFVRQHERVLDRTVYENVALGRVNVDELAVRVALDRVGGCALLLHDRVGEGAQRLSGGERQRLALARALVGNPALLLVDEATQAFDAMTAMEWRAVVGSVANCTVIAVTHDLGWARDADEIWVLEGGRLVESGAHDRLLALGGLYARLWQAR